MSDNPTVNSQITDAVTQTDVKAQGDALPNATHDVADSQEQSQ